MARNKRPYLISDEEIVKVYQETKSLRKTSLAARGIESTNAMAKKLRELGVEVKNHLLKPINASDEELTLMYNSGMSLMEIAKETSGSKGAMKVRQKLQELGIDTSYSGNIHKYKQKMSEVFHRYALDEHVFDVIDTEEKAYWLGFLMADGYNQENRNAVALRLQANDGEILEKFSKFLKSNAPIYIFSRITRVNHLEKSYREVLVHSPHLSKLLALCGCTQGKTYTLEYPTCVPERLTRHFIRGYFDGDGCVCITKRRNRKSLDSMSYLFTITGREEFLLVLLEKLISYTGVTKTKLQVFPNNFARNIHYGGRAVVFKLLDYLYKDSTIYLKRKYDKYQQMVVRQSNLQK